MNQKTKMKRYKITLLVPHSKEILAANEQEAHKEATRLTQVDNTRDEVPKAILHSVEYIRNEPEPIDFGFPPEAA